MASFCPEEYSAAMRNKINKTNFAITGAAALLVGLAGTAQAIPMPAHTVQTILQGSAGKKSASRVVSISRAPVQPKKAAKRIKPIPPIVSIPEQGVIPMPPLTTPLVPAPIIPSALVFNPVIPAASTIPVPDGGATGAMLGGVFGGLVLLRKKLKA
jgi:hypothetical protein